MGCTGGDVTGCITAGGGGCGSGDTTGDATAYGGGGSGVVRSTMMLPCGAACLDVSSNSDMPSNGRHRQI